jgi:hypothetical protein
MMMSVNDIVHVIDDTDRQARVDALSVAGYAVTADRPLYVHNKAQAAGKELQRTINGTDWYTFEDTPLSRFVYRNVATSIPSGAPTVLSSWTSGSGDGNPAGIAYLGVGVFQVPSAGVYAISGCVTFNVNGAGRREAQLNVNAAQHASGLAPANSGQLVQCVLPATNVLLSAGDQLSLSAYQNSGGAITTLASSSFNTFSIARVG